MPRPHRWSVTLAAGSGRHPRWLDENGQFSSDPARALRLASPEVAVQRIHDFLLLHGVDLAVLNRFRLVPSPPHQPVLLSQPAVAETSGADRFDPIRAA